MNKLLACMLVVALGLSSYPVYATDTIDESNEHMEDTNAMFGYQLPEDDIVVDNVEPPADDSTTINLADDNISSNVPKLDDLASDDSQLVIPQGEDEHDFTPYFSNTVTINQSQTLGEIETAIQAAIDSASSGETVTISGYYQGAGTIATFIVPAGKVVEWKATVRSVSLPSTTLIKQGPGLLILSDNSIIQNYRGPAVEFDGHLIVRGGFVQGDFGSSIKGGANAIKFDMEYGTVEGSMGAAISMDHTGGHVHIQGGTVSAG